MCGIIAAVSHSDVNQEIHDALVCSQHRGQEAAGMMTCKGNTITIQKSNGLVREVFRTKHMLHLLGNMGIGHVRYPTAGTLHSAESQPFYVNSPYGLGIAHNGNLINTDELKYDLITTDLRHLNTNSDSEVLLNVFAHELQRFGKPNDLHPKDVFNTVRKVHQRCKGAYAVVILIAGKGILAFRDPYGIRPIVYGKRHSSKGDEYMIASESIALDALGYQLISDILPGEAIYITKEGKFFQEQCADNWSYSPCIFEFIYLARPDSIIDNISVYQARLLMGETLADKILAEHPDYDIDVVIPIPETSRTAAMALSEKLGVKYREGFVKNRYIGRTFIMPGQKQRQKSVRQKLNPIISEFKNKKVLLVDDSIVRGTTSKEIIQMVRRDAGAEKVYFASAAPEVRFPNVYGIDMPSANELIAHGYNHHQIANLIGADWLVYQDLKALYKAIQTINPSITRFEDSVFTGDYVTGNVSQNYLNNIDKQRNDQALAFNNELLVNLSTLEENA